MTVGAREGKDIGPWVKHGIPGADLLNSDGDFFPFHHSRSDTMHVLSSTDIEDESDQTKIQIEINERTTEIIRFSILC